MPALVEILVNQGLPILDRAMALHGILQHEGKAVRFGQCTCDDAKRIGAVAIHAESTMMCPFCGSSVKLDVCLMRYDGKEKKWHATQNSEGMSREDIACGRTDELSLLVHGAFVTPAEPSISTKPS